MTSHTETHNLIERAQHLARLGWAVEKHAARGEVEFRLTDLRDTAHALEYADLAHACDKGGDELDGPVTLTDEPGGDAMRWEPREPNKRPAGVRIFTSADVDHISIEATEWEALCGRKTKHGFRPATNIPAPGVRLCARCEALRDRA